MTQYGDQSGPQGSKREDAAIAALMDPVALEARLADARMRRERALSASAPATDRAAPVPRQKVPNGFLAGLALGVALAGAALTPVLMRSEGASLVAPPEALPAAASEPEPTASPGALAVAFVTLGPEPRPADLKPAATASISTRNAPVRSTSTPQPALLTAIIRQGRVIETSADAGLREVVRTADRFVSDLGRALPKPTAKALREALRATPGKTKKAPRKD